MQMPKPTEAHDKLQALVGSWVGRETLPPSPWMPEGGTAEAQFSFRRDLDGFFLIGDYEQRRDGQVTFRGHMVIGYDAPSGKYAQHWFDSMGMDPGGPAMGTWEDNVLHFEHETPMGHARYVTTFNDDDSWSFHIDNSRDGQSWQTFVECTYRRA